MATSSVRLSQLSKKLPSSRAALSAAAAAATVAALGVASVSSSRKEFHECSNIRTSPSWMNLLFPHRSVRDDDTCCLRGEQGGRDASTFLVPAAWPATQRSLWQRCAVTHCEAPMKRPHLAEVGEGTEKQDAHRKPLSSDPANYDGGMARTNAATNHDDGMYHGLFPRRQLWRPRLEYPLWDYDWDGRHPPPIGNEPIKESSASSTANSFTTEAQRDRHIRKNGITRHIILIRHGQYDETYPEDEKRILTPLGRKQAQLTGQRLGAYIRGVNKDFGPCKVRVLRVSNLERAKETAGIIYDNLGLNENNNETMKLEMADPDPLLNEGRPCHYIPGSKAHQSVIDRTDEHHPRIENAFRKYFYRAHMPGALGGNESSSSTSNTSEDIKLSTSSNLQKADSNNGTIEPHSKHEFEIIVCHANVIRYFFCRALQLPPEAWLRLCVFNCSLTYFTIRPTGTVSCRMLGDIGHLPYDCCTFSMHTGFNW